VVVLRGARRTHAGACVRRLDVRLVVVVVVAAVDWCCSRKESWGTY
jgi:hypothetical protein